MANPDNRTEKRSIGALGEDAVCQYLIGKGAEILCRNFTIRGGEIDIIAALDGYLLLVEVKTRRLNALVSGAAAVTPKKQQLLIRTAEAYLRRHPTDLQPRFDVAEVLYSGSFIRSINYFEHAFYA